MLSGAVAFTVRRFCRIVMSRSMPSKATAMIAPITGKLKSRDEPMLLLPLDFVTARTALSSLLFLLALLSVGVVVPTEANV